MQPRSVGRREGQVAGSDDAGIGRLHEAAHQVREALHRRDVRATLLLVRVEQSRRGAAEHVGELPGEVGGIACSGGEALAGEWRGEVRGVASEQDGNRAKAGEIWRALLAEAPPDAPWADTVHQALAEIGNAASPPAAAAPSAAPSTTAVEPGPNAQQVAAAAGMSENDRSALIRDMVAQLAGRLQQDGSDIEGWRRLLGAYMVLGERDKANAAAADARRALARDPDKLRRIDDLIKGMGLAG